MLLWILLLIVIVAIFGVGFFFRLFLWIAIALLVVWLIALLVRGIRR